MAIAYSSKDAVVLDHESWILQKYENYVLSDVQNSGGTCCTKNLQQLFDLRIPFMMDGQAQKVAKQMDNTLDTALPPRKRAKKSGLEETRNSPEVVHIKSVYEKLKNTSVFKDIFSFIPTSEDYRNNNKCLRDTRRRFLDISNFRLPTPTKGSTELHYQELTLQENTFILPNDVEYICDDVKNILHHCFGKKYDLIIVDPPWYNKYIRRQNKAHGHHFGYEMMSVADIMRLPLGDLLNEGALVAIWCTNNDSQMQELIKSLGHWGVDMVATWYWLKVTRCGEMVTSLITQGHRKLPYERLILAKKCKEGGTLNNIPEGLVLCSIPSGIHSHKPPISEILKDYVAPHPKCLEVFARYLIPGWTSYGLEVLKLQHEFIYK